MWAGNIAKYGPQSSTGPFARADWNRSAQTDSFSKSSDTDDLGVGVGRHVS
jgi:hypothetical protein